jgi:hypothetical protein
MTFDRLTFKELQVANCPQHPECLVMDMVHHNPGEPPFETPYNDPSYVADIGYNSKAYFLFESPTLAIE